MAGFRFEGFRGVRPRVSSRLLPQGEAEVASNVRLGSGDLEPWRGLSQLTPLCSAGSKSFYYYDATTGQFWLEFPTDVDVVRNPVAEDTLERLYFTGAPDTDGGTTPGKPKYTTNALVNTAGQFTCAPKSWRYLGVPAPATKPVLNVLTGLAEMPFYVGGFIAPHALLSLSYPAGQGPGDAGMCAIAAGDYLQISTPDGQAEFTVNWVPGTLYRVDSVNDQGGMGATLTISNVDGSGRVVELTHSESSPPTWTRPSPGGCNPLVGTTTSIWLPDGLQLWTSVAVPPGTIITFDAAPSAYIFKWPDGFKLYDKDGWPTVNPHVDQPAYSSVTGGGPSGVLTSSMTWRTVNAEDVLATIESRSYVYTYVNSDTGEEGPPSPASDVIDVVDGMQVNLSGLNDPAPPYDSYVGFKRIYRTVTGSQGTEYLYVDEIPAVDTTYSDQKRVTELGDPLETTDYALPPDDLQGLVVMANGVFAGFRRNELWLSSPNQPHAWPYTKYVDADIVALAPLGDSLVVLTDRAPYIVAGASPDAMSPRRLDVEQACVSKKGVAVLGGLVIYPSPDGLVGVTSSGATLLTEDYLTKREWAQYHPETMVGAVLDEVYYGFYDDNAGSSGAAIFSPKSQVIGFSTAEQTTVAAEYVPELDQLALIDSGAIKAWDADGGAPLTYTWRSRVERAPYPLCISAARVVSDTYPVTFKLYANGVLKATVSVTDDDIFRLPGGYLESVFQVEVSGTARIRSIRIGESVRDLLDE